MFKKTKFFIILFLSFISLYIIFNFTTNQHISINQESKGDNSDNVIIEHYEQKITIDTYNEANSTDKDDKLCSFSIQYMRAFGASKVPLFMQYVISKDGDNDIIAAPEFRKYWRERWEKPLYPVANNIWNEIINNDMTFEQIYAKTIEPERDQVINFYLSKNYDNYNERRYIVMKLEKGFGKNIDPNWNTRKNEINESDIGFLFIIIENDTDVNFYNVELLYDEIKNNINIDHFLSSLYSPSDNIFKLDWKSPRSIAVKEDMIEKVEKVKESKNIACIRKGEAIIWLLCIYSAKKDGMPDYYLSDIQIPYKLRFIIKGKRQIEQEIRAPYGEKAARISLPKDWLSMQIWMGQ